MTRVQKRRKDDMVDQLQTEVPYILLMKEEEEEEQIERLGEVK